MEDQGLAKAIAIAGSQSELARRMGGTTKQQHISLWLKGELPAEQVRAAVAATDGQVSAHELRPDLYPPGFEFPPEMLAESREAAA